MVTLVIYFLDMIFFIYTSAPVDNDDGDDDNPSVHFVSMSYTYSSSYHQAHYLFHSHTNSLSIPISCIPLTLLLLFFPFFCISTFIFGFFFQLFKTFTSCRQKKSNLLFSIKWMRNTLFSLKFVFFLHFWTWEREKKVRTYCMNCIEYMRTMSSALYVLRF